MRPPRVGTRIRAFSLNGHIGDDVSALVDGQLDAETEEHVWQHVLCCPGCRRLVESEGWTRTQLRTLPREHEPAAPGSLVGALYALQAWEEVERIEHGSRLRRAATAVVGVGSVGAAMVGLLAVTSPPAGRGEVPGPAPAMIRSDPARPTGAATPREQFGPGVTTLPTASVGTAR